MVLFWFAVAAVCVTAGAVLLLLSLRGPRRPQREREEAPRQEEPFDLFQKP